MTMLNGHVQSAAKAQGQGLGIEQGDNVMVLQDYRFRQLVL